MNSARFSETDDSENEPVPMVMGEAVIASLLVMPTTGFLRSVLSNRIPERLTPDADDLMVFSTCDDFVGDLVDNLRHVPTRGRSSANVNSRLEPSEVRHELVKLMLKKTILHEASKSSKRPTVSHLVIVKTLGFLLGNQSIDGIQVVEANDMIVSRETANIVRVGLENRRILRLLDNLLHTFNPVSPTCSTAMDPWRLGLRNLTASQSPSSFPRRN